MIDFLRRPHWKPLERRIWIYAVAATPAWILYCLVTGIFLFEQQQLERVPSRLSPVFGTTQISPGDIRSQQQGFEQLLRPSEQTFSDSRAHREAQRAQDARIADARERNRLKQEYNEGNTWRVLSRAFGYPIAWLGALLTIFEVRSRLEDDGPGGNNSAT